MVARTETFTEVDGVRTRYLEEGKGPPVVLVHGSVLGSSADVWDRTMGPLAAHGLHVLTFDQPGFGASDPSPDASIPYRRRFILRFMDALGIHRAGLVGHSQAGGFVVAAALEHPERVSGVMVLGTGSLLPPLPGVTLGPPPGEGVNPSPDGPTIEDIRKVLEEQLYDHSLITPEVLQTRLWAASGRSFEARRQRSAAPPPADQTPLWQRLDELRVPLLVLHGADDHSGTVPQRVALLRERYPELNVHIADRCKHLVPWDAAEEFVRLAGEFFREG